MRLNSGWRFKQAILLTFGGVLLITGSTLLWRQIMPSTKTPDPNAITLKQSKLPTDTVKAALKAESITQLGFQQNNRDVFNLLLTNYRDKDNQLCNALLFPKNPQESVLLPTPIGQRQAIWETAAKTIAYKAPQDALFLSWWDDGQRLHFLSGHDAWLSKPALPTFNSPLWKSLQASLILATNQDHENLKKMARWLTMDSRLAVKEINEFFGTSRPVYLVVSNDLLMRLSEIVDYGGTPLAINSSIVPVSDNLHNDISRIKRLAQEEGDGNYLVQKEGLSYHLWYLPKLAGYEKNALLVRLLPFVSSLKQPPENLEPIYRSSWGSYLSIYKLSPGK